MVTDPELLSVRMGDLKRGMETPWYEVRHDAQRQPDGTVRVAVRHFAEPWGTYFVYGDPDDEIPLIGSQQLTITHDAGPLGEPCQWCNSTGTDGSPCPWSLVCPQCLAEPGEPCRRPSGHLEVGLHEVRVSAAEGRPRG
jgi:hypothetical protein